MSPTTLAPPAGDRPTVFISYSHRDEEWKDHVVKHLKVVLDSEGVLEPWDDRNISAGDDWRTQIEAAMERAAVAVLLISKDSLVSPFIKETEVPYLLQRRDTEGIRIIPLIVHACGWQAVPWIEATQCRPKDGKALSGWNDHEVNEALTALALEIRGLLNHGAKPAPRLTVHRPDPELSISHLPITGPTFVGRETERARLNAAWDASAMNVFSLVAFGGVGKSSLVNAWLEDLRAEDWRGAERVFGWSFYSQGTDATGASCESFVNEALWWFGYGGGEIRSAWEKGVTLAQGSRSASRG
jgi:hypothetical protein